MDDFVDDAMEIEFGLAIPERPLDAYNALNGPPPTYDEATLGEYEVPPSYYELYPPPEVEYIEEVVYVEEDSDWDSDGDSEDEERELRALEIALDAWELDAREEVFWYSEDEEREGLLAWEIALQLGAREQALQLAFPTYNPDTVSEEYSDNDL